MVNETKLRGSEITVSTTANTVGNSSCVRIYAPTAAVITVKDANTSTIGTMTMPAGWVEVVYKATTDTISANVNVQCTPLAIR